MKKIKMPRHNRRILSYCRRFAIVLSFLSSSLFAQEVSFTSSGLIGIDLTNPTSLDFGPDGRLYVAQQDGTIYAYTIQKNGANDYQVSDTETILLIKNITNHNDDGTLNTGLKKRQVTGLLTTGTSTNPVLFVSSSDPRIGGGGSGGDKNLDTNSGIISKLSWNGAEWEKIDVVKGLPRSEENHATNGLVLDETTNTLFVAQGGHTNAGAPSNNFAFITEYALSAAVLEIDLNQIESEFGGSYDLPTLDDPARENVDGKDPNDPFGGNDGLNQAKLVPDGPVQIHSPGYRNIYDLVLTQTPGKTGRIYTIDNGPNGGWGGHPDQEGAFGDPLQTNVTNNYVTGEPGSNGPGPNDDKVNNRDNLHLVSKPGMDPVYGGHPTPIRANPAGAGLYWYDNKTSTHHFDLQPTVDWPPVPLSMANPIEGDYQNPGVDDNALYTWKASTNGIAEYTSGLYFQGEMKGDLLAASFDGKIYRIQLNEDGTEVIEVTALASGFGSTPLDVIAQPDNEVFPGTIWAATYGADNITIFEPVGPPSYQWENEIYNSGSAEKRHENAFVEVKGKFYLVGGRGNKNINIYDPQNKSWTTGKKPPLELHHFQAINYNNKIYVIGAFTGGYPGEKPVANIYIYDPETDQWTQGSEIPEARRRGSAGCLVYQNKIYVVCGITNGHIDGWVNWLDVYDPATNQWTVLPDAPRARDHFHAAVIDDKIYLASGRQTTSGNVFGNTVAEIDVFDIELQSWSTLPATANIPTQRAGAGVAVVNEELFVIGGESDSQNEAHNETEALNPLAESWTSLNPLNQGRHGSQVINFGGKLYIAAGSGNRGGGPELTSMEVMNTGSSCTGDNDNDNLDDDGDGYSNLDESMNGTDPCSAASKPDDLDQDLISDLKDDDDDNDGITDAQDYFPWDADNGTTTNIPIDYPFLNGDPGFGLFGVGVTGLMSNGTDNYADLFDANDPDLIVGGAVGIFSIPAASGDAENNDQKYAFQLGLNVDETTPPFTIQSKLQGDPFFDGISISELKNQSQGIYLGTGDQDNYLKLVLHANNGNPGFQILSEDNGITTIKQIVPVDKILEAGEIDLFFEVNPASGIIQCAYQIPNNDKILIGDPLSVAGNTLEALQKSPALAVGIIASSAGEPSYSASWDFLKITNTAPYVINPYPEQKLTSGQESLTIPLEEIFADDNGAENLSFEIVENSNPQLVTSYSIENTDLILNLAQGITGSSTITIKAADETNAVESSVKISVSDPVIATVRINAGGPAYSVNNEEEWQADNYFNGGKTYTKDIAIAGTAIDEIYQTERYGNFNYSIPVPEAGAYVVELHFAEIYHGIANDNGEGSRIFNVSIEDDQATLSNLDILAEAGEPARVHVEKIENIQVNDGFLDIAFETVTENAKVSGISVYQFEKVNNQPPTLETPDHVTLQEGESWEYQVVASDPDEGDVLNYESENLPASLYIDNVTGLITGTIEATPGAFEVKLKVTDQSGLFAETSFTVTIEAAAALVPIVRLNSGGSAFTNNGEEWSADAYANGGETYENKIEIEATENDVLYQTERYGNFKYAIPVPEIGKYTLELHFAEIFQGIKNSNSEGARIFNLAIENEQHVEDSIDLIAEKGKPAVAIVKTFSAIEVEDGYLNIEFTTIEDNAKISGIAIYQHTNTINQPPVINAIADVTIIQNDEWSYQVTATDPEGESLKYKAENLPNGLTIDSANGNITGLAEAPTGEYEVVIKATDPDGLTGSTSFIITVEPEPNQAPTIEPIADITLYINQEWSYQVKADDPDGDKLSFEAENLPMGLSVDETSGLINGTVEAATGEYHVNVKVDDGKGLEATTSFKIILEEVEFSVAHLKLVSAEDNSDIQVLADGDVLVLSELPAISIVAVTSPEKVGSVKFGLNGNSNQQVENILPYALNGDRSGKYNAFNFSVGTYEITATAYEESGAKGASSETLTLSFQIIDKEKEPNQPPTIAAIAPITMDEGTNKVVPIEVTDPENGNVTVSGKQMPSFASIEKDQNNIYQLNLNPEPGEAGDYNFTIEASDPEGLTVSENVSITVNSINLPPTVSVTVEDSYCYDEEFDIQIVASDPEGQTLQFTIGNGDPLPSGLNMNSETGLISGKIAGDGSGISQSHAIEVVVSDTEGEQTEILVSISVVDCEASMEVLSFTLVNSESNNDIFTLSDGQQLDLSQLPDKINLRANVNPEEVGSVRFDFNGKNNYRTENVPPYALAGDNNGNYLNLNTTVGNYNITATPFAEQNGKGVSGKSLSISFDIVAENGRVKMETSGNSADPFAEDLNVNQIKFYPNPTAGILTLELSLENDESWNLVMIDMLGKHFEIGRYELNGGKNIIDLDLKARGLQKGIYMLRMQNQAEIIENFKIIIQ